LEHGGAVRFSKNSWQYQVWISQVCMDGTSQTIGFSSRRSARSSSTRRSEREKERYVTPSRCPGPLEARAAARAGPCQGLAVQHGGHRTGRQCSAGGMQARCRAARGNRLRPGRGGIEPVPWTERSGEGFAREVDHVKRRSAAGRNQKSI